MTECTARSSCTREVDPPELTCPVCIGKTRNDLTAIVTLAALMPEEAEERGTTSEAAMLAGPVADPSVYEARRVILKRAIRQWLPEYAWEKAHTMLLEPIDEHHPAWVLGTWEMLIREDYGPQTSTPITVASAAGYLDRILHRLAHDPHQDFALFASEVASCRRHLEAVAHNQAGNERGVQCYMCGQARLERKHREQRHVGCLGHGNRNGCRRMDRAGYCTTADGRRIPEDGWACPACAAEFSPRDYERAARARWILLADELPLREMADRTGVAYSTLRRWASTTKTQRRGEKPVTHPPKIRPAYTGGDGRKVYRVAEVEEVAAQSTGTLVTSATVSTEGAS